MKVAINKCYGGFSLSNALYESLIAKGWEVTKRNSEGVYLNPNAKIADLESDMFGFAHYCFIGGRDDVKLRTDPDLIEAIENLGEAASGRCGNVQIVEVPDGVEIEIKEYDGFEHIAEVHRTWQ